MQVANELDNLETVDPTRYLRQKDEYKQKRNEFMRKHLRRAWPIRPLRILGIFQLVICLAILAVDLPIILMFAPRWQVFAGCWTFLLGFIACVGTFHSTRKMTWRKLKWVAGLNILAGAAAAVMVGFDILYLVNPYVCVIAGGCKYLWYTYTAANSCYTGQVIVGIAYMLTVFIFVIIFIKHGIGGVQLFDSIQSGRTAAPYQPMPRPNGARSAVGNPTMGRGASMSARPRPPPPPLSTMPRYQSPGPSVMMARPTRPMMMPGSYGPPMVPGQGPPPQTYYRQPGPPMVPGQGPPPEPYYR